MNYGRPWGGWLDIDDMRMANKLDLIENNWNRNSCYYLLLQYLLLLLFGSINPIRMKS